MTDKLAARMAASSDYVAQLEAERDALRAEVARLMAATAVTDDATDGIRSIHNACMFREICRAMLAAAPEVPRG